MNKARIPLLLLLLAAVPMAFAQGVAVPNRPNRPQPKVKLNVPLPKVQFQDIAAKAGLTAPNVSGPERDKQYIIETIGSGVALFDYDNDGWLDIFIVNGTTLAPPPKGQESTGHLYRNNHDGTFADVTQQAGLTRSGSFLSQNDLRLHFGLGKAIVIERAEVVWPSGRKEGFANLKANQVVVLEEGQGRVSVNTTTKAKAK